MFVDISICIFSALLLWVGANFIVDSASAIARKYHISELVIGLTIVALGTSAPEFLVTITAAFKDYQDISLSNIVGSNIFNLGFILGLMALIRPLPTHKTLIFRDGLILWGVNILILLLCLDLRMGRPTGILLLLILVGYNVFILSRKHVLPEGIELPSQREATVWDFPKLLLGFIGLALGGNLMVESASHLAGLMGVSTWVIGVTVVAAGTSLPELITCLAAAAKGRNEMLLGNLIGSDFFNFAGVLGLTCVIRPLQVSQSALPSLYVLIAMVGLVLFFMRTGWRVTRWEGALLVAINLGRWWMDFGR